MATERITPVSTNRKPRIKATRMQNACLQVGMEMTGSDRVVIHVDQDTVAYPMMDVTYGTATGTITETVKRGDIQRVDLAVA